jgi:hypothetical protein
VIAVNTSFRLAPWADVLYACDTTWWGAYFPELSRSFRGEMWTISSAARDRYGLKWIFGVDRDGLCPDLDRIHTGRNSGFQAISLAYVWGVKKINLLGYDMQRTNGKTHWHGDHPRGLGNSSRYSDWIPPMNKIAKDLEQRGVDVVNCSRSTALRCFRQSTIEKELP